MKVCLLGPVVALDGDGSPRPIGGPKQRAVLALLALEAGKILPVESIVDGVWGEDPPARAVGTVQVYVHGLRKALGDASLIVSQPPGYRLDPRVRTDLQELAEARRQADAHLGRGDLVEAERHLDEAESLWRGDPLSDLRSMDFANNVAVRLEETRLLTQEVLLQTGLDLGRHRELLPRLEQLVAEHPTRETLWHQLLLALYRSDRQGDALAAFRRVREVLADELGVDPGPALRDLEIAILRQDPALDPPETPRGAEPAAPPPRPASRVPQPAHPLVGREDLVATVLDRLSGQDVRLVTLTGPGGVGKTRSAVEVARALPTDELVFVDLVDAVAGHELWTGLGAALGLAPDNSSAETVLDTLAGRPSVLVLDNMEQVEHAAEAVSELLAGAPDARVLVTSRTPLRLVAEHVVPVPTLDQVHRVELFLARARATKPDFELGDRNRHDVELLCDRLDGLPLALEIAAAGARMLTVGDMLDRLDRGLDRLGAALADLPVRQRTLSATVSWSLDLLPVSARTLCARLSVFEGGFTVAAATDVCADGQTDDAVDDIALLIDSNLVVPLDESGEARFRLYGAVRDVVRREVPDAERSRLATAHATWYAGHAEQVASGLDGAEHERAIHALVLDEANLDRALLHAAEDAHPDLVARLVLALAPFWIASGRAQHGSELVVEVTPVLEGEPGRVDLDVVAGLLAYHLTDWDRAVALLSEVLPILDDQSVLAARARCHLAAALTVTGRADEGRMLAAEAGVQAERLDVYDVLVLSLSAQAIAAAIAGDFETEVALYRRRLVLAREHEDRARTVDTLTTLAEIDMDDNDWSAAGRHATEALSLAARWMPAEHRDTLIVLARIALAQSDLEAARSRLAEALELTLGLGETFGLAQVLRSTAGLAAARGDLPRAARLVGASERLRETTLLAEGVELDLAGFADSIRAKMAEEWYDEEVAAGRSLARIDVLDLAQKVLVSESSSAS